MKSSTSELGLRNMGISGPKRSSLPPETNSRDFHVWLVHIVPDETKILGKPAKAVCQVRQNYSTKCTKIKALSDVKSMRAKFQ